ncbi:TPA: hypothetical protein ACXPX3_004666 [Klebsiella variicola subsp. variicola]|jgi:hypothetical protein|uniref:hypothetical protein n=1 Tax=Klebsiella TaxID=570 RepID=UPI002555DFF9|nr:hypothetical protein [Klebsiella quasipneumoniae]MBK2889858.1 hypothetical protein [Klebsiella pneumoniae]HBV6155404.1 hypothetical protein [Klebsiella variicola]
MSASLMVVVLLVLFLFIPACIALFMSGRSLLQIFLGAVACQATVAVAFAGLSARGWSESRGMGAASLIFYVIGLNKADGVKQNTHNGREKNES